MIQEALREKVARAEEEVNKEKQSSKDRCVFFVRACVHVCMYANHDFYFSQQAWLEGKLEKYQSFCDTLREELVSTFVCIAAISHFH